MYVRAFLAAFLLAGVACSSTVEVRPDARNMAPTVGMVVAMPTSIEWDASADQRRLQRRMGDALLELTGGRAVVAEELEGQDDGYLEEMVRSLGEDPARAVTFTMRVGAGRRLVNNASPISSFRQTKRMVVDFAVRIEVRRVGAAEVIGAVDTVSVGAPNEPEIGPAGERQGALAAIDEALDRAVRTFAPRLFTRRKPTLLVEIPAAASHDFVRRLEALQQLYPELTIEQMQLLASSRERFLVVTPGSLARLGLAAGDLLGVPGGDTGASRAALARAVASGKTPLLAINRGGQHFLTASR